MFRGHSNIRGRLHSHTDTSVKRQLKSFQSILNSDGPDGWVTGEAIGEMVVMVLIAYGVMI